MAFKGLYVNIDELIERAKKHGPITAKDAEDLLGDQPSTRFVLVDGEPAGKADVTFTGKVMKVK